MPVPPHSFALDAERLSYARFEKSGGGFAVTAFRSVVLPPELFHVGLLGGSLRELRQFQELLAGFIAQLPSPPRAASLVLPDAWLRVAFAESEGLPVSGKGREDVLRFKLKRLVPFRVEELRVQAAEIEPLERQAESGRVLLGFALEHLLSQLEDAFSGHGIRLGQITNASLAVLGALEPAPNGDLTAAAVVSPDGYSLLFARHGIPAVARYKPMVEELAPDARAAMIRRDLKLTRTFVDEQVPGAQFDSVLLSAPPGIEAPWSQWLAEGLEVPVEPIRSRHLPPLSGAADFDLARLVPLLGAACLEVA